MAALVTQEEAMRQLRLQIATTSTDDLADVMFKAEQASAIIVNYLKRPDPVVNPLTYPGAPTPYAPTESPAGVMPPAPPAASATPWTEDTCPPLVKAAILIALTSLYDGRTPDDALLSGPIIGILERMRDPALA